MLKLASKLLKDLSQTTARLIVAVGLFFFLAIALSALGLMAWAVRKD